MCEGMVDKAQAGCHGVSPIIELLPYADYNNVFVVPICHALLYGPVKKFLELIVPSTAPAAPYKTWHVSAANCQLLQQRSLEIRTTADFGRPFR